MFKCVMRKFNWEICLRVFHFCIFVWHCALPMQCLAATLPLFLLAFEAYGHWLDFIVLAAAGSQAGWNSGGNPSYLPAGIDDLSGTGRRHSLEDSLSFLCGLFTLPCWALGETALSIQWDGSGFLLCQTYVPLHMKEKRRKSCWELREGRRRQKRPQMEKGGWAGGGRRKGGGGGRRKEGGGGRCCIVWCGILQHAMPSLCNILCAALSLWPMVSSSFCVFCICCGFFVYKPFPSHSIISLFCAYACGLLPVAVWHVCCPVHICTVYAILLSSMYLGSLFIGVAYALSLMCLFTEQFLLVSLSHLCISYSFLLQACVCVISLSPHRALRYFWGRQRRVFGVN